MKWLLFLVISFNAFARCPSFNQMAARLEGIQDGTPISVKTFDGESIDEMYENYVHDTSSMYFNKSLLVRKVENSRVNESKKIDRLLKLEKQGDLFARLCIEEAKNRQRKEESEKWL